MVCAFPMCVQCVSKEREQSKFKQTKGDCMAKRGRKPSGDPIKNRQLSARVHQETIARLADCAKAVGKPKTRLLEAAIDFMYKVLCEGDSKPTETIPPNGRKDGAN